VERIGRDVEIDEIERHAPFDQRGAEEVGSLDARESQREGESDGDRQDPQCQEDQADPNAEALGLFNTQRAEARSDGNHHVWQHRHLQQLDEAVGDEVQRRSIFTQEQAECET
jgi:hypothetical protein